jgi:hypothetical protein
MRQIKAFAIQAELARLKTTAFKSELAARRKNLQEMVLIFVK